MSETPRMFLERATKNDFAKVFIIGKYENGDVYIDGNVSDPKEVAELLMEAAGKAGVSLTE